MSALGLRLPNSLHERARGLARREGVSINQLVSSALLTEEYLEARARRGSRARFLAALARVPAVEPDPEDALFEEASPKRLPPTKARRKPVAKRKRRERLRG